MRHRDVAGLAFIMPALLLFCIFTIYPVAKGLSLAFYDAGIREAEWIGLANYRNLFQDPIFWKALWNTARFVIYTIPLLVILPLVVAFVVHWMGDRQRAFLRFAYYLPVIASGVVMGIVWMWIFHPMYGLLNYFLIVLGIEPIGWLGRNPWAFRSICAVLVFTSLGWSLLIYMAAMGSVDKNLYDAAEMDGCNRFRQAWHVTIPGILPVVAFIAIVKTIGVLQLFQYIWLLTRGGPTYGTITIVYLIYQHGIRGGRYGYASAEAVVLFVIIVGFCIAQYKLFGRKR